MFLSEQISYKWVSEWKGLKSEQRTDEKSTELGEIKDRKDRKVKMRRIGK